MMYAKSFRSMYDGSLYGAGMHIFAVWQYALVNAQSGFVELLPKKVAATLGGKESDVVAAIDYLSHPDPGSRSKAAEGRRMVKEGQYQYRIVNWDHYQRMRNEADRREYNRLKQAEYRARKKRVREEDKPLKELPGEREYVKSVENGEVKE